MSYFLEQSKNGDDSSNIIMIVCIVIGLILFALVGFLLYHCRTCHRKFHTQPNRKAALIVTTPYDKQASDGIHFVPDNKVKYDKFKKKPVHNNGMFYSIFFVVRSRCYVMKKECSTECL